VIDLADARTNRLLWRGQSSTNVDRIVDNQQWLEEYIDKAVAKIFDRLPRSPRIAHVDGDRTSHGMGALPRSR
jgi:hypothetical protein